MGAKQNFLKHVSSEVPDRADNFDAETLQFVHEFPKIALGGPIELIHVAASFFQHFPLNSRNSLNSRNFS